MRRPRLLHVASFVGNIGDNASHRGLARLLGESLGALDVTRLEMRKFYRNYRHADRMRFDDDFVAYANGFDLLVIGGGGFLDWSVPGSASGTTIDMEPSCVERLVVPTLMTSLGCWPLRAVPDGNVARFRRFLDAVLANPRIRVGLRNDGSAEVLGRDIGAPYRAGVAEVLDHGFFYDTEVRPAPLPDGDYVALNITDDQIRMQSTLRGDIREGPYERQLAEVCQHLMREQGLPLVFVPHIWSDLNAIGRLLAQLDDYDVRTRVTVAPCVQGDAGADWLFGIYRHSRLVLATRLHANICSLAMGKRVIGLAALDRVQHVHEHCGTGEDLFRLDTAFAPGLVAHIARELEAPRAAPDLRPALEANRAVYRRWLGELGLA